MQFYAFYCIPTKAKFGRFLDSVNMEDKKTINTIKREIKLILYNKRKIPMETKNKLLMNKLLMNNQKKN